MLRRILALLAALADLADMAICRSYAVRVFLLWVLRRAELVARDWIMDDGADGLRLPAFRSDRAEARRLARSFRALGRALRSQLRQFQRLTHGQSDCGDSTSLSPQPAGRLVRKISVAMPLFAPAYPPPDTS